MKNGRSLLDRPSSYKREKRKKKHYKGEELSLHYGNENQAGGVTFPKFETAGGDGGKEDGEVEKEEEEK